MNRSALIGFVVAVLLTLPLQAKTITGERAAQVTALLETCVQAVREGSNAPFGGYTLETGFVPVAYLFYERWIAPDGQYKVIFGQRGDKPGRPYICEATRLGAEAGFLSAEGEDRHIIDWVNQLSDTRLAGVSFTRGAGFKRASNANALSACIGGQMLVLSATVTNKGAARFGVGIPLQEVLKC